MVCGHLAQNRWPDVVSHPLRVVDGAAGFVLLSGLVLGQVQRRRPDLLSPLRRARRIWAIHVGLLLGAFGVKALTGRPDFLPAPSELGSLPGLVLDVALLRVQPDWFAVLPFYVVALLVTPLLVLGLSRGRARWVAAGSGGLYLMSQVGTWNPSDVLAGSGTWDWAGWQLLFVMGFTAGWHWATLLRWTADLSVRRAVLRTGLLAPLAVVAGHALPDAALAPLFDKFQVAPGVPVVVLLLGGPAYWAVGRLPQQLVAFLAQTGRHSLGGYVSLSVVQFLTFAFWIERPVAAMLVSIAAVVLLAHAGPGRLLVDPVVAGARAGTAALRGFVPAAVTP